MRARVVKQSIERRSVMCGVYPDTRGKPNNPKIVVLLLRPV